MQTYMPGGVTGLRKFPGRHPLMLLLLMLVAGGWLLPAEASAFWPFSRSSDKSATVAKSAAQDGSQKQAASGQNWELAGHWQVDCATLLYHQVNRLGSQLLASLEEPDPDYSPLRGGVIVLSFVDQKKLDRTTSFGRYLAEQLMNDLQQRRVPVVELRQSLDVRIQAQRGEYGLSRNPAEIRSQVSAAAMVTGTYTATAEQVVVNARIIDNASGVLLASATAVLPRTAVVDGLLADPVSGKPVEREPMYMKSLEF